MKPIEPTYTGQQDLFRSRLDQIIDMKHELVVVAEYIDWDFLVEACGEAYSDKPGHPALSTRLLAGLHILKYARNLSDEKVLAMWRLSPYYQYFCGEEFFRHDPPMDRSSLTRWRQRMGEVKVMALLQESLSVALRMGAVSLSDFGGVPVDTTLQPKNVAHPRDARLPHRARKILERKAAAAGIGLRQSYTFVGEREFPGCTGFKRNKSAEKKGMGLQRRYLGRVVRDVERKIDGNPVLVEAFREPLRIARNA